MENKSVTIKRVPLEMLLVILTNLYEQGVDFVDVIGRQDNEQDHIGVSIDEAYLAEGVDIESVKMPQINLVKEKPTTNGPLDEDDLNQLI